MPDPALVHEGAVNGRATHVIAIGIGQYDHLPGGSGRLAKHHLELKQVSTPPASARAIASWFIEKFDCTDRPLASVSLVLSEKQPAPFTNVKTGTAYNSLPSGKMLEVREALRAWMRRAETDPDNAAVLYFCGHGLSAGVQNYYLLRDYGKDDEEPLLGAINFRNFLSGLSTKTPTFQFLLFDACRSENPVIDLNRDSGQSIFMADPAGRMGLPPHLRKVQQCPIFSTEDVALGRPNEPSLCAQAFIRVMNGAAARKDDPNANEWFVTTHGIDMHLSDFQNREASRGGRSQSADANSYAKFRLRRIGPRRPPVPVFVRVKDAARRARLKITAEPPNQPPVLISDPTRPDWQAMDEWVKELEVGNCIFKAVDINDPNQIETQQDVVAPSQLDVRF